MARHTLAALTFVGAVIFGASVPTYAQEEPQPRELWFSLIVACFPEKEAADGPPQCKTFTAISEQEMACHALNMNAARAMNMQSGAEHPEYTLVECLPFTLSVPGRGV